MAATGMRGLRSASEEVGWPVEISEYHEDQRRQGGIVDEDNKLWRREEDSEWISVWMDELVGNQLAERKEKERHAQKHKERELAQLREQRCA